MMKYIIGLFLTVILISNSFGQASKLLEVNLIDNLEETPIYPRLTETIDGKVNWKNDYQYIDNIEMNRITGRDLGVNRYENCFVNWRERQ